MKQASQPEDFLAQTEDFLAQPEDFLAQPEDFLAQTDDFKTLTGRAAFCFNEIEPNLTGHVTASS